MPTVDPQPPETPRTLSPDLVAAEEVTRRLTFTELSFEIRLGHHLGYLRTLASPRVADLLAGTGQTDADPHRRATDTALFVWELIHHGLDSVQGRSIVRRVAAMHHRYPIRQDDYRWVLTNFVVPGLDVIDRFGWRPITPDERHALILWWNEVGVRLGVDPMPPDAAGWVALARDYEARTLVPNPHSHRLLALTTQVAVTPVPRPLRPLVLHAGAALFDPVTREALGLPDPGRVATVALHSVLRVRAARRRRRGPGPVWFVPGAAHQDYPDGYRLDDLGPRPSEGPGVVVP